MITPSFSPTATERVLPKLALDFTTASLDPRVTFTRTTGASNPATYVDSNGYITAATNNQARFDYDPITLACKGLLIEEPRQNLIRFSEQFDNGNFWQYANTTVLANAIEGPDGTLSADEIVDNTVAGSHYVATPAITTPASGSLTFSVFLKKNTLNWAVVEFQSAYAFFDINVGVIGNVSAGATAKIEKYKNDFYRCSITSTSTSATTYADIRLSTGNGVFGYTGTGKSLYAYGAQLEAGAFATSYIPTTTTALTRNADVATMTGTNFSDWWTVGIGATNVSATQKSIGTISPLVQFDDNTINNIISLRGNVSNPELYIKTTTDQAQIDAGTIVANTAYNLVGTWGTNNCAASQNGASAVVDTSATIPTVTQARIGSDGTNYANAWLQKINYWPQRITNNETQAFSK